MGLLDALFGQQGIPGATPPIVAGPGGLPQRRGFLGGLAGGLGNLGGLLGGGGNPSLMSPDEQAAAARRRQAMAIALLQASGPSTQRTGFGEALGNALQAGQASDQGDLQQQLLRAQLKALNSKSPLVKGSPGDVFIDPATGQPAYSVPATDQSTASWKDYQKAREQGYDKSFVQYQTDLARAHAEAVLPPPNLQNTERPVIGGKVQPGVWNPRKGTFEPQGEPVTPPGAAKRTQQEATATLLYGEMRDAAKQLDETSGSDTASIGNAVLGSIPGGSAIQGQDFKKYEAAGLRWAQNFLYLKSGASAPAEEVRKTFIQYLPQPGDGQTVKDQKAIARQQAEENVASANGLPAPPVSRAALLAEARRRGLNLNARP